MKKTSSRCIAGEQLCDTGFSYTLSLISGKYKMTILYALMEFGVVRYNELQRYIKGISYKTLSCALKELESDGLILRKEYPQIPSNKPNGHKAYFRVCGCQTDKTESMSIL